MDFTKPSPAESVKPRILIAEDSEVSRQVTQRQLERLGFKPDVVGDGTEAVEAVKRQPYEIIFMDCNMPQLDGYQATWQIRHAEMELARHPGATPVRAYIIAITAQSDADTRERCRAAGMDDYLVKPVRSADLGAAVLRATTQQAGADTATVLDPVVIAGLMDLREAGKPDPLKELIGLIERDAPAELDVIQRAIAKIDMISMSRVISAATRLKGTASNIGAHQLALLCDEIVREAVSGTLKDVEPLLVQTREQWDAVKAALQKLVK